MSSEQYLILAYIVGIVVLWGYGALLWIEGRKLRHHESSNSQT